MALTEPKAPMEPGSSQCSQPSSLSIVGVGRDGLRLIVRHFGEARTGLLPRKQRPDGLQGAIVL